MNGKTAQQWAENQGWILGACCLVSPALSFAEMEKSSELQA